MAAAHYDDTLYFYLDSNKEFDLSATVRVFSSPVEHAFLQGNTPPKDIDLWSCWSAVIKAARRCSEPQSQAKLVAFVREVKARGPLKRKPAVGADDEDFTTWAGTVWSDLPFLGPQMRESWSLKPPRMSASEWTNVNSFAARLTAANVRDFSLYGLWSLRDSLEEEHPFTLRDTDGGEQANRIEDKASLDELLPAMMKWVQHCGPLLLGLCRQSYSFEKGGKDPQPDPGFLGKYGIDAGLKSGGFNLSRWDFWVQRLEEISNARDDAGGREKIAKVAFRGLERMKNLSQ